MSAYSTYIMGVDAIYDPELIKGLVGFSTAMRRQKYLASWRILHVDGFESGLAFTRPLPASIGHDIHFTFTPGHVDITSVPSPHPESLEDGTFEASLGGCV